MKTKKFSSVMIILALLISFTFTNLTYSQWGNGWWGDSGWSTSDWWGDSGWCDTGWDSSGSDSTWWWDTWWDNSGSDSDWTDTGWDSSGSDNTWSDSTGWDNSWSENSSWNWGTWAWWWWGDQVRSMLWEITQLKARISQDSLNSANWLMNRINNLFWTGTTEEDQLRYQMLLQKIEQLKLNTGTKMQIFDVMQYLELRIKFKIWILEDLWTLEWVMTQEEIANANVVKNNFEIKLEAKDNDEKKFELEHFLWQISTTKEMLWNIYFDEAAREKSQNMLQYIEMKMYQRMEELENE